MQAYVEAPQLVRDLDWVTRDWPQERRDTTCADNSWPKVQRYVLMGVEGAYSDWHIDFAGSSVLLSRHLGSKRRSSLLLHASQSGRLQGLVQQHATGF